LNNIELIDYTDLLILFLFDKLNQVSKIEDMKNCCLFVVFTLKFLTALIFFNRN